MPKKNKIIFFLFIIIYCYSFSQNEIKILQSNYLQNYKINKKKFDMFCGNVIAEFKEHKLYCDTIFISNDGNYIKANSKNKSKIIDLKGSKIQSKKIDFCCLKKILNFRLKLVWMF